MKRGVIGILIFLLVIAGIVTGRFYYKNLRGTGPALKPPPEDITKLIPATPAPASTSTPPESKNTTGMPLHLPSGFSISIFAKDLGAPRVMKFDAWGDLLVSIPSKGMVVALKDANGDGVADETITVAEGLRRPHGLETRCDPPYVGKPQECTLYIAEENQVASYDLDRVTLSARLKEKLADLPTGGNHTTRTLLFSPEDSNTLLVSIGSSCNVCNEKDPRRAAIYALNLTTKEFKPYAKGLRNAVFMAVNPVTKKVWATEMGRDLLGDDLPPDEINIIESPSTSSSPEGRDSSRAGQNLIPNFGWPVCYGKNVHDTAFDKKTYIRNPCMEPFEIPSSIDIPAHSAPLGIAFIGQDPLWYKESWNSVLVAYHGSWNRSVPTGYKVVRMKFDDQGNYLGVEDFITGWLTPKGALGRPVDLLVDKDSLYISDDKAGVIYRMVYQDNSEGLIHATIPKPNDIIKSPLVMSGEARGTWFFEASFPVRLLDGDGKEIVRTIAQAQGEWMTENFVPFDARLEFKPPITNTGTLVLERDNPSGLPENDRRLTIPVRFGTGSP